MSARAGIIVTGTEVLTGRVSDRNGPWLADRLRDLGVDLALTVIVGDRPADIEAALRFMADAGMDLVLTSGGLGPTADDLTAEVVGRFQGREMVLDAPLQQRIAQILAPLIKRWPNLDREAIHAGNAKQATVPAGATVLEPVGTAPGLVVPPGNGDGPTIVVLPGPPRELQPMWGEAVATPPMRAALAEATEYRQAMLRLFGIPESEIAETLREADRQGVPLERLEITTCLKRGEIEVVTRYEPDAEQAYEQLVGLIRERHADTLFSEDGSSIDDQVSALLRRDLGAGAAAATRSIATAESCTGGMLAARLTDPPGASDYFRGAGTLTSGPRVRVTAPYPVAITVSGAISLNVVAVHGEPAAAAGGPPARRRGSRRWRSRPPGSGPRTRCTWSTGRRPDRPRSRRSRRRRGPGSPP